MVKCVDTFRIALTKESKLLIKQKYGWDSQLSVLLSSSDIENNFFLDFENLSHIQLVNANTLGKK